MSLPIKVNVTLSPKQRRIADTLTRFSIIRAGRRFGKTYLAVYTILKYALTHPNTLAWYVCSDISTCTELIIPEMERICPTELIKHKNRQTRTFTFFNGARIVFKTGETKDALRGRGLDFVVMEEVAFWKNGKDIWYNILRPQLTGRGGRAIFISSPNGSNWFRQLENSVEALIKAGSKEWSIHTASIHDNPMITSVEIEDIRKATPELTWLQEYEGLYVDQIGLVHWEFNRAKHSITIPPESICTLRVRGMDWGISDETACIWMEAKNDGTVYVYDEYSLNNTDVPTHSRNILQKTTDVVQYSILDSSCWNRDASMTSVAKRFATAGIPVMPATKDFDGTISDLKALFETDKIFIADRCKKLMLGLETWQHGSHEPDVVAAFRYGVSALVKAGKIMAPMRISKPRTFQDVLREDARCEARRQACARQKNTGLSFKIIDM